jgi:5'-methylthioadenosine phosphorylase
MVKVGIIGGSGLEDPDILKDPISREISTRFGAPSSALTSGCIGGVDVVLLSRHGKDHTITPTGVPNRANLVALQEAGCTHLVSTTAVGSLREEIGRGDLVIVDQFIDFTRSRDVTLFDSFEDGLHHTPMADPFDRGLRELLLATARGMGLRVHPTGTVVTIEGPRFSTRAESRMFRAWGADIINMSIAPECILANELGLPYATVAMSTDYDCWKEDEAPVTWEAVLRIFQENADKVKQLLLQAIPNIH